MFKLANNTYLYPMFLAIFIVLILIVSALISKPKKYEVKRDLTDRPFDNPWSNWLYELSYSEFFSAFIPETEDLAKSIEINAIIARAGLASKMNHRVYTTIQILIFLFAGFATMFLGFVVSNSTGVIKLLFNVDVPAGSITPYMVIGCFLMLFALLPRLVLQFIAGNQEEGFVKDLPVLQLFIILMIKSKRTVGEIIYTLSRTNTRYKGVFSIGYQLFIRDRKECFAYLADVFKSTGFKDTIIILETNEEYSREESINILQSKIDNLLDDVEAAKKHRGVLKGLLAEGSIALPFAAFALLSVVPVLFYALDMLSNVMSGF